MHFVVGELEGFLLGEVAPRPRPFDDVEPEIGPQGSLENVGVTLAARRRSAWDWPMLRHDAAHTGAQLGDPTCTPATCAASMPFTDGFERGSTTAWIRTP